MRRPSRLTLAAVAAALPLALVSGCASDEPPIRAENGNGVDGETGPDDTGDELDGDQGGAGPDDDPDEG